MKISQEKKCYFFCYESVEEDKNLTKSVKRQGFELETFFVKENLENLQTGDRKFYVRCV